MNICVFVSVSKDDSDMREAQEALGFAASENAARPSIKNELIKRP